MINYFSLLIPILLLYMARYYILKYDYEQLKNSWQYLFNSQSEQIKIIKDHNIDTIGQQLSENEEENNAI